MELLDATRRPTANATALRNVLAEFRGAHVVRLRREGKDALLIWEDAQKGARRSVHIAFPFAWLDDPSRTVRIEAAARSLAQGILAEC